MKDGKDSDDSEEDSDFEDPDEIEVPGGGKDLDTMLKVTGKPSKKKNVPNAGRDISFYLDDLKKQYYSLIHSLYHSY